MGEGAAADVARADKNQSVHKGEIDILITRIFAQEHGRPAAAGTQQSSFGAESIFDGFIYAV